MQVQSGVARTGKWWGFQQFDDGAMNPDILVFAKGIASGWVGVGVWVQGGVHLRP